MSTRHSDVVFGIVGVFALLATVGMMCTTTSRGMTQQELDESFPAQVEGESMGNELAQVALVNAEKGATTNQLAERPAYDHFLARHDPLASFEDAERPQPTIAEANLVARGERQVQRELAAAQPQAEHPLLASLTHGQPKRTKLPLPPVSIGISDDAEDEDIKKPAEAAQVEPAAPLQPEVKPQPPKQVVVRSVEPVEEEEEEPLQPEVKPQPPKQVAVRTVKPIEEPPTAPAVHVAVVPIQPNTAAVVPQRVVSYHIAQPEEGQMWAPQNMAEWEGELVALQHAAEDLKELYPSSYPVISAQVQRLAELYPKLRAAYAAHNQLLVEQLVARISAQFNAVQRSVMTLERKAEEHKAEVQYYEQQGVPQTAAEWTRLYTQLAEEVRFVANYFPEHAAEAEERVNNVRQIQDLLEGSAKLANVEEEEVYRHELSDALESLYAYVDKLAESGHESVTLPHVALHQNPAEDAIDSLSDMGV